MFGKRRRKRALQAWRRRRTDQVSPGLAVSARSRGRARHRAPTPRIGIDRSRLRALLADPRRLVSAVAALAALGAATFVWLSPSFRVTGAMVSGNERIPAEVVVGTARILGQRSYLLNGHAVAERVLSLADVKSASVRVAWPARVWIVVAETAPVLRWETPSGTLAVDELGRMILPVRDISGLPRVTDAGGALGSPGQRLDARALAAALEYSARFASLSYGTDDGFAGVTPEGWHVRLGTDPTLVQGQMATLDALTGHLSPIRTAVALVDLRFPGRPYYRLHDGAD